MLKHFVDKISSFCMEIEETRYKLLDLMIFFIIILVHAKPLLFYFRCGLINSIISPSSLQR